MFSRSRTTRKPFQFSIRDLKEGVATAFAAVKKTTVSASILNFVLASVLVLFYNASLWKNVFSLPYPITLWNIAFFFSLFIFLGALFNLLLLVTAFPYLQKPFAITLLMLAAGASYFMDTYGILIDWNMVQNTFETDISEATELLSVKLVFYIVVFGILPSLIVWHVNIRQSSLPKALLSRLISGAASLLIIILILLTFYQDYSSFFRNNRYLRHLINPINFIYATTTYASSVFGSENAPPQAIALDAQRSNVLPTNGKHNLMVLVVGEAARAVNFSLNGYRRITNPKLQKQDVINFPHASSCGTATAVSVPCMFSKFERSDYSHSKAQKYEGLLDILSRVGFSVLWRENNSGCKGACDRVPTDELSHANNALWCDSKECFDEILLNNIDDKVEHLDQDVFIVLHQKGSHGPSYFQRYPKAFEQFTPVCKTNQLQDCTRQEITNAYDNSLLYTDHFLNEVIEFLVRQSSHYNTAMLYLSDHGESLGEHNIYLHGTPYFMAPTEQTHIPFFMWFSKEYQLVNNISVPCLTAKSERPVSQDNLFHSVLGLNNITTDIYEESLDIFSECRKN